MIVVQYSRKTIKIEINNKMNYTHSFKSTTGIENPSKLKLKMNLKMMILIFTFQSIFLCKELVKKEKDNWDSNKQGGGMFQHPTPPPPNNTAM